MDSKICFEMSLIVVETIHGRCASFRILTATVSEIFGGLTNASILVVYMKKRWNKWHSLQDKRAFCLLLSLVLSSSTSLAELTSFATSDWI